MSVIYLRPSKGYWPHSGFAHPSGHIMHFDRRWWGWRTTYLYSKELVWFTKSRVVRVPKCTLAKWAGLWNTAWRSTLVSGNTAQSGVAEHPVDQMHEINWKEAEVVDSHPYYRQRCVLEAWHIHTEHQTMNRDEGPLPSENSLIRQLRPAAVWPH